MVATTLLGGEIFTNYMAHKGRHQQKKNVFFRAFPESPKPPPPDPSSGNLVLFFMSKTTFCAYDRKKNLMLTMKVAMIIMMIIMVILIIIMTKMTKKTYNYCEV